MPRGKLKPYTPAACDAAGSSYFWGGLVRLDVVSAPLCMRLTFNGFNLPVTRCDQTAGADAAYDAGVGLTLTPPLSRASADELGPLVLRKRVEVPLAEMGVAADVCVSGLGWVTLSALASLRAAAPDGMRVVLDVWVPRGVEVSVRSPMPIGGLPVDVDVAGLDAPENRLLGPGVTRGERGRGGGGRWRE